MPRTCRPVRLSFGFVEEMNDSVWNIKDAENVKEEICNR